MSFIRNLFKQTHPPRIAFIACVEAGNLENQVVLLFRSIRKYAGQYKDVPIYSFQPRQGAPLNKNTLKIFEELCVVHNREILNTEFEDYPVSNKIFACARAEEVLTEEILVFLDSDTVIVNDPTDFALPKGVLAAARPVETKNLGSTGRKDPNDEYWRKMYAICDVPEGPFIETSVGQKRIRAYWNAGLIVVLRSAGLFQQWKQDFFTLIEAKHIPRKVFFMDQLALAATFARVPNRVRIYDLRYNYPLAKRPLLPMPYRAYDFEDLIHIHYHRWFNKPGFLDMLKPPLNSQSEIYEWISAFLPFEPTIDDPLRF